MENSETLLNNLNEDDSSKYHKLAKVIDFELVEHQLKLYFKQAQIVISFLKTDLFRLTMTPDKKNFNLTTTPAIVAHNNKYKQLEMVVNKKLITIKSSKLKLVINRNRFSLAVYDSENNLIHSDYKNFALGWQQDKVRAWKDLDPKSRFYGLGEKTGWLDKKGRKYEMWNNDTFLPHVTDTDPLYQSIPFLITFTPEHSYGIYFDNSYRSFFDLSSAGQPYYSFWAEGGQLDYYFLNGPDLKKVISSYTNLTGTMPLPPKWALGYHQSRYSYYPQSKVKELAKEFRQRQIPCDAFHFDIHYMDQYKIYTWDQERFPDPAAMISNLQKQGIKAVTIIDPGVKQEPEYELYKTGIENNYFCKYLEGKVFIDKVWPGNCAFPDFTQTKVRNWWAELQKDFVELGVKGIWNDMNEPAVFNQDNTMSEQVIHQNDGQSGSHKKFHNLYALLENMATYQGLKSALKNERPFVLTRAGFAGIQRSAAVWTGDNRSFWEHLKLTMPMLMNLGMSGIPFCGSDVGGFTGNSNGELLTRWIQLGTFMPFFRNHCEIRAINQEPWSFGSKYETIIKKYIELRYQFLTHFYNLFYQASKTGIPVLRPLLMEFTTDKNCQNLSDQFLIGDNLLIAPIYKPDTEQRLVYLPAGEWINYWTEEVLPGKQHIITEAPLEKLPIFVKANSLLPLTEKFNYVGEKKLNYLELNLYLGSKNKQFSYTLYDDDGLSFDYQVKNAYQLSKFSCQNNNSKLIFKQKKIFNNYPQEFKHYKLIFHNLTKSPQTIYINGKQIKDYSYSANKLEVSVPVLINKLVVNF
ncbi:glycoside hydrolase family 31 protein [Halanaerobium salsuginis]|uniref:Alpha-glucosidase n=1 Tax=Halanaerobium salsuginis TaxID=29563 RepID=A0A1I4IF03_9FIRM|nr:TIM-barrel domain-containing protein [Halanaerobium salsuginis]SFL52637.1 alpha-glucosidase [Halanaerobium salsuginis]